MSWLSKHHRFGQTEKKEEKRTFNEQYTKDTRQVENTGNNTVNSFGSKETEGTPYFLNYWVAGQFIKSGKIHNVAAMRLNVHEARLEAESTQGKSYALDYNNMTSFTLIDAKEQHIFKNGFEVDAKGLDKKTFFRIKYDGAVKLLVYDKVNFRKGEEPQYGSGKTLDSYSHGQDYYIVLNDKTAKRLKTSKKAILKLLADKKGEIETFVNAGGLDYKNEASLLKIVAEYERLKK